MTQYTLKIVDFKLIHGDRADVSIEASSEYSTSVIIRLPDDRRLEVIVSPDYNEDPKVYVYLTDPTNEEE